MFAQVITGKATDRDALSGCFEKWERDLKPGAPGYLGSTGGVAADGTFIAVARFETEDDARKNSDRPEQGQWWEETAQYLEPDVAFHDCTEVDIWLGGGSDDAGFVQVLRGKVTDVEAARRLNAEMEKVGTDLRPDVIGGLVAWHGDAAGEYTEVVYFTSEQEAREGEKKPMDAPELEDSMKQWDAIRDGDITYIDLSAPWFSSP